MKTLIIDDAIKIRRLIRRIVTELDMGLEICGEVADGKIALEMIETEKPDLLFLDIVMPVMSGIDLLREINKIKDKPYTIIISSYDDFKYVKESMINGAVDYILKPFDKDDLKAALTRVTKKSKEYDENKVVERLLERSSHRLNIINLNNLKSKIYYGKCITNEEKENIQLDIPLQLCMLVIQNYTAVLGTCYKGNVQLMEHGITRAIMEYLFNCSNSNDAKLLISACEKNPAFFWIWGDFDDRAEKYSQMKKFFRKTIGAQVFIIYENRKHTATSLHTAINELESFAYNLPVSALCKTDTFNVRPLNDMFLNNENLVIKVRQFINEMIYTSQKPLRTFPLQPFINLKDSLTQAGADTIQNFSYIYSILCNELSYTLMIDLKEYMIYFDNSICCRRLAFDIKEVEKLIKETILYSQRTYREENDACLSDSTEASVKKYIDNEYCNNITLDFLSKEFYINKQYLATKFKKIYNCTIMEYIQEKRLEKSKELLVNSILTISDICDMLNYTSNSYFAMLFKRRYGTTPTEYRKKPKINAKLQ